MSREHALMAIDQLLESPSPALTVEFQGGEPLLAFDTIRFLVEEIKRRNVAGEKAITFAVTTTLHFLTRSMLDFFKDHNVSLSTSLDGPEWLHNANRPNRDKNFSKTSDGISFAREVLGEDSVAALTTLTRKSLDYPEAIIDTYVEHGFRSIFLRPLSPYGFAVRSKRAIGYGEDRNLSKEHDVLVLTAAKEALALCANGETFDLILCDLMMPDMTGMDLHRELSLVAPEQANKKIFLTGGAFTEGAAFPIGDAQGAHREAV